MDPDDPVIFAWELFTCREVEIMEYLKLGLRNRQIADKLFIGEGTVKTHVEHIIGRLGVENRVAAGIWAAQNALVPFHKPSLIRHNREYLNMRILAGVTDPNQLYREIRDPRCYGGVDDVRTYVAEVQRRLRDASVATQKRAE